MNKELITQLIRWPKPFITGTDLSNLLQKSPASRQGIIKRAVKEGVLLRIKRDLYVISSNFHLQKPDTFELAQLMFGPSYISLESALNYHRWIPEAVYSVTSVCVKSGVEFDTPLGHFSYNRIPARIYPVGISRCARKEAVFFMAKPWKALADLVYLRKKNWPNLRAVVDDLRVEPEVLQESNLKLLEQLGGSYPNQPTRQMLTRLYKELSQHEK